jgi:hypothetical protein
MNWTKKWENDRGKLKEIYFDKGIIHCEARLPGCMIDNFLSFHHRHKRAWYKAKGREKLLGDFNQTVLVCQNCHSILENDRKATREIFRQLRGID